MSKLSDTFDELEALREANDGLLRPVDVVEFAKQNPGSALHKRFEWDDGTAAQQYRLWQARVLIKVHVVVAKPTQQPITAYVSLDHDRKQAGGGYRSLQDVLSDNEQRAALLRQAMREAATWREKYKSLKELSDVFAAMDRVTHAPVAKLDIPAPTVKAAA